MVRQNIETVAGALELFVIRIVWEKILILLARVLPCGCGAAILDHNFFALEAFYFLPRTFTLLLVIIDRCATLLLLGILEVGWNV